jgi:hypothetical protein
MIRKGHKHLSKKEILIDLSIPEPNSGCWIWTGAFKDSGYGRLDINKKTYVAHRLSWTLFKGKIPKGSLICHKCDNRSCINPDHLFVGTYKDNMQDCLKKNRFESRATAKLKKEEVLKIRRLADAGASRAGLARRFNVSRTLIHQIISRKIWNHI